MQGRVEWGNVRTSGSGRPNGQTVHPQDAPTCERTDGAPLAATNGATGGKRPQAAWRRPSRADLAGSAGGRGIRRLVGCYGELAGRSIAGGWRLPQKVLEITTVSSADWLTHELRSVCGTSGMTGRFPAEKRLRTQAPRHKMLGSSEWQYATVLLFSSRGRSFGRFCSAQDDSTAD